MITTPTKRNAGRGVLVLWGLTLVLSLASVLLAFSGPATLPVDRTILATIFLAFASVGALVAWRVPGNRIGWLFLVAGLLGAVNGLAELYPERAFIEGWPGATQAAWVANLVFFPSIIALLPLPVLLFPTGRPPTPRWRWVGWAMLVAAVVLGLGRGLGLEEATDAGNPAATILSGAGFGAFVLSILGAVASMLSRFRRSRGEERQQLKWFAYAAGWAGLGLASTFVVATITEETGVEAPRLAEEWIGILVLAGVLALPVAAGVAILRYRLYDIDLVINRTLVYAMVTVMLGAVYVSGVVGLPRIVQIGEGNDLVVAVSTLAVAALFNPVRRRVQGFVDRSFYRSRYDAAQTVRAFSTRLRQDVGLQRLQSELTEVVRETLQPESVTVWLQEGDVPARVGVDPPG